MSFRPPFPNATFPPRYNNNNFVPSSNDNFTYKFSGGHQTNVHCNFANSSNNTNQYNRNPPVPPNVFVPRMSVTNKPIQDLVRPNPFHNSFRSGQQTHNVMPFPFPVPPNPLPGNVLNVNQQPPNLNVNYNTYFSNPSNEQNQGRNPTTNFNTNTDNTHLNNQRLPFPPQSTSNFNSSTAVNFQGYQNNGSQSMPGSVSTTFNSLPPNFLPAINRASNMMNPVVNNQVSAPMNNTTSLIVTSTASGLPPVPSTQWMNNCIFSVPPPILENNNPCTSLANHIVNPLSEKELKLADFLAKFTTANKKTEHKICIPEFRSALKGAFSLMNLLSEKKSVLKSLINANESEWSREMQSVITMKEQLSEICSIICSPPHLKSMLRKIKCIKKKRDQKKKTKLNKLSEKIKVEQHRKELHQEIDKWLDDINEKNLKLKREVEMKKEADFILLEVRRKIQEANRTIEKIKVFEKLRNVRLSNAVQKGLCILPEHNDNFEKKVSILKETMLKQLADYEAEERALKVMLETEQEGQLEERSQWELKKIKTRLQKRQNHIVQCLFGISEDPLPTDPLYLFHKYHTSANNSIDNLVQIRHQWDVHLSEDGESVPQQWVVPVAPSNSLWEKCLK